MNILIDARPLQEATYTGIHKYTYVIISSLIENTSADNIILYTQGKYHERARQWTGSNIYYLHQQLPSKYLNTAYALIGKPDIKQFCIKQLAMHPDIFFLPNLSFFPANSELPYILTVHDISFYLMPELYPTKQKLWHKMIRPIEKLEKAKHICSVSEYTTASLIKNFGIAKEKISTLSASSLFLESYREHGKNDGYLLLFADRNKRKNTETALQAFCNIKKLGHAPNLKLYVCGNVAHIKHTHPDIVYLGYIHEDEVAQYVSGCNALLFPSLYEGLGIPVLQALYSNKKVIAAYHSALAKTAQNAYFIDPYNISDIEKAIIDIDRYPEQPIREALADANPAQQLLTLFRQYS